MEKYIKSFLIILFVIYFIYMFIQHNNVSEHFGTDWDSNIDGMVYINLENRDDRKELALAEFKKINTNMSKVNKVSGIYIPKNGHKGCVQSHLLALYIAKMNKWKNVLILEDDFELNVDIMDFNNKINYIYDYFKDTNTNWDVIMLGTSYSKKENINNIIVKINSATTGTAYIVNNTYYDTLIDLFNKCNDNMSHDKWTNGDWEPYALDQQWLELQKKDNWFGFSKDLFIQRNIRSSTNEILIL